MKRSIRCYSEGAGDIGRPAFPRGVESASASIGPLQVLVGRIVDAPTDVSYESRRLVSLHSAKGYAKKAELAVKEARRASCIGAVIVVDRDGVGERGRLGKLKDGRDKARSSTEYLPTAVGVAVEKFEAWLLADGKALTKALSTGDPVPTQPDPEKLTDPKASLNPILERCRVPSLQDNPARMAEVARHADLSMIERRCPKGFKPFADEVRAELGPLFRARP